ncbi:MAG: SPOR domain-containing protein [Gammaproteobacteria bacterium]
MFYYHYKLNGLIKTGTYLFIFVLMFSVFPLAYALEKNSAINATKQGNYTLALNLWTQLAKQGDSVAQYNLGVFYSKGLGTKANNYEANRWFRVASQSGLVQAYNRLKTKGIKPSGLIAISTVVTPEHWVTELEPSRYTLQLASSKNKKLIEKYYLDNNLQDKAGYYTSMRQGEKWYALVFGSYTTVSEAKIAFKDIPADLRKWSPWVRKIKDIHSITAK